MESGDNPERLWPAENPEPLLNFCCNVDRLKTPGDVVEALHAASQSVTEVRSVYNVMGAWYMSRVVSDLALVDGKTMFLQKDLSRAYRADYFAGIAEHGAPSVTQQLARTLGRPFTFTEGMRVAKATGADRWVFDVMRKNGIRDGFYCPFGRWAVVFWCPRRIEPNTDVRNILIGASAVAVNRISVLMPHPERYEIPGGALTNREIQVLRLAAGGYRRADIARRLEISPRTVDHLTERALGRLGARTVAQAVAQAMRHRLFA